MVFEVLGRQLKGALEVGPGRLAVFLKLFDESKPRVRSRTPRLGGSGPREEPLGQLKVVLSESEEAEPYRDLGGERCGPRIPGRARRRRAGPGAQGSWLSRL